MIWAYLHSEGNVELYASEADKPAPAGYTVCELPGFVAAWALRDSYTFARLHQRLIDPYEAELCGAHQ